MALTKDDLQAVRSIIREETNQFVTKDDLRASTRELRSNLINKADLKEALAGTESRLSEKIEFETGKIARMVAEETLRLRKRDEEIARHVGYTFEPEPEEKP